MNYRKTACSLLSAALCLFCLAQIASTQEERSFEKRVGKYAVSLENIAQTGVEILVIGGVLHLRNSTGTQIELIEESKNNFHLKMDENIKLRFMESDAGVVDSFVIDEYGQKVKYTRLDVLKKQLQPDADSSDQKEIPLEQLAGKFALSPASLSRTTVEMIVKGGSLYIKNTRGIERELVKETKNRYHLKANEKVKFNFIPSEGAGTESFVLQNSGQKLTFRRVELLEKKAQALYDLDKVNPKAANYRVPEDIKDGLKVASIADAGAKEVYLYKLLENLEQGAYDKIDSLLILKDGKLVVEQYYNEWSRHKLHPMQSISKSITSLLVGSAIMQGYIAGIKDAIVKYLPDYAHLLKGGKEEITIQDLLTMSAGLDWDEHSNPYTDPENIRIKEAQSDDSVAFTLSVPMINKPGEVFTYSGGYVSVVGEVIRNATGAHSLTSYWKSSTLVPLGIEKIGWIKQADGRQSPAGGAVLRPRDLAKIGQMMLDKGLWRGERVLDESWVEDSLTNHISPGDGSGERVWTEYGYFWWGGKYRVNGKDYAVDSAQGWGGQELLIIDKLDLVVVVTATNYSTESATKDIMTKLVIPAWVSARVEH